jgi:hypothetical protein
MAEGKQSNKQKTMHARTFFWGREPGGVLLHGGRTSPEPRSNTPWRPHWPLVPQWATLSRTRPTQGIWNWLELEKNEFRSGSQAFVKSFQRRLFPILFYGGFFLPLAKKRPKMRLKQ